MSLNKALFIILLIFCTTHLVAQNNIRLDIVLDWKEEPLEISFSNTNKKSAIYFEGAKYTEVNNLLPTYYKRFAIAKSGDLSVNVLNEVYKPLNKDLGDIEIRDEPILTSNIVYGRKQPFVEISILPLRKNETTGQIEKLESFTIELLITPSKKESLKTKKSSFISNSILVSGEWYKFSVKKDGVYKIDYDFLENIGIDVDNINPKNIRIYGNGGGMLPEANSAFRYDDLVENSITVIGESDNVFDKEDYILFYGENPDRWILDTATSIYSHIKHLYSEDTYYFINVDLGVGKRINTQASVALSPTNTVTSFDDIYFHEIERENLITTGREWMGEEFDIFTTQSIDISIPDLITSSPIYLKSKVAGRSTSGFSTFMIKESGNAILSQTMSPVGVDYTNPYASGNTSATTFLSSDNSINLEYTFVKPNSSAIGWIDYFELNARRQLNFANGQLQFQDFASVGVGNIAEYNISGANNLLQVWEVTNPRNVTLQQTNLSSGTISFVQTADSLRTYIVFDTSSYLIPIMTGKIANQNLHAIGQPDYVIVTTNSLLSEANRLADFHRNTNGLSVEVVDVAQIYNEFSSGAQDLSAIRDFLKMLYDRAGIDSTLLTDYLLLLGDASYDYKNKTTNNTNMVPVYQSVESFGPVSSFSTDDYVVLLDDNEGASVTFGSLDIGVGRIPAKNISEAKIMVDKIIHYSTAPESFGAWRQNLTFVADDEDGNLHLNQVENLATYAKSNYPVFNDNKIYFDAYEQVSSPGGNRYPDVRSAIKQAIEGGTLFIDYLGHGGGLGWAHERVLTIEDINGFENYDRLALFFTATCEFSRFDLPGVESAGEQVMFNPKGGAIALMTTARITVTPPNFWLNQDYLSVDFRRTNGVYPRLGDVLLRTKVKNGSDANSKKFALLGDPAMRLGYPNNDVFATKIDSTAINPGMDTLRGLQKVTIEGRIYDNTGTFLNNFNGIVTPVVFDKAIEISTLANDPASSVQKFKLQKNIIYKGKASVVNGVFSFTFILPKDIGQNYDYGRFSFYAVDGINDAAGYYDSVVIGGTSKNFAEDLVGPEIDLFLNDEKFVNGGTTNEEPLLIAKLKDQSGINTVGSGIGHDITVVIDDNTKNTIVLNDFYEAALDNFQEGEVQYRLPELEEGSHTLKVKAWDVYNNSSEALLDFVVANNAELAISHVLNYPNPFTTKTSFQFEHNKPGQQLDVKIQIYTVAGKLVKTIDMDILTVGNRVDDIVWDGLDDFGDKIGRGVYVYRLKVNAEGLSATQFEKLVILQ